MGNKQQNYIGIFDSGIGGLTVANAVSRLLPNEHFIYFGDTAHHPYGEKSPALIQKYVSKISNYFVNERQCKAIVIACNTAAAVSYVNLRNQYQGSIPIINVIDPIIETVVRQPSIKNVGVIATKTTIESGVYQEKLTRRGNQLNISALPTPLLASMIEEGFYNNTISQSVIVEYLSNPSLSNLDALILGCTHYPLIKNEISAFYNNSVKLIDSTDIVAEKIKHILGNENRLNNKRNCANEFYVSDYTEAFEKTAVQFYNEKITLKELKL